MESRPDENPECQRTAATISDWKEQNSVFTESGRVPTAVAVLIGDGEPEEVLRAVGQPPIMFSNSGAEPLLGRTFSAGRRPTESNRLAVVISYGLWNVALAAMQNSSAPSKY